MINQDAMVVARNLISERQQANSASNTTTYYSQFWGPWDEAKKEGVNPTDFTNRLLDAGILRSERDRSLLYKHLTRRDRAERNRQLAEFNSRHRAHMAKRK
jgi:hypothetical protein